MSAGTPYPYRRDDTGMGILFERPDPGLATQNQYLIAENTTLRREMKHREERAYEHGLGDAAKVYRENRILAATIAALIDRQHPLCVPPAATEPGAGR